MSLYLFALRGTLSLTVIVVENLTRVHILDESVLIHANAYGKVRIYLPLATN